ncbi:MAG: glycosyltransferase involved in cell wall biosynthesis [Saprospiraceae bacterium]|jgi:glycosyltransferase involved in cell wall biosynthesis
MLTVNLQHALADEVVVGLGTIQLVRGSISHSEKLIKQLEVIDSKGQKIHQSSQLYLPTQPCSEGHRSLDFVNEIAWSEDQIGLTFDLYLRVTYYDESSVSKILGSVELIGKVTKSIGMAIFDDSGPKVVICMATYCPPLAAFQRQIDSILLQTHQNWHLIICDDASNIDYWPQLEAICRQDPKRISLIRHEQNLGFYHNFERALHYVPESVDYVAFADQDDLWYPEKLQSLMGTLQSTNTQLAYSDMRVVDEKGGLIAPTYWQNRKNEYVDFDTVFLANTVTGAASLFSRSLLLTLLPFPEKIGDAFHDHWLACTALAQGPISYADKALYDYYQYGSSVIGHCDFKRWSMSERVLSIFRIFERLLHPTAFRQWLGKKVGGGIGIYRGECNRLRLMAQTLTLRGGVHPSSHSTLNLMQGEFKPIVKLLWVHVKILVSGKTTDDAEFRLAMGCLSRVAERRKIAKGSY